MYFVTFYMNGCERSCRTYILACTASDALLLVNGRNLQRVFIRRIFADHPYCLGRTMSGAVAAVYIICIDYAVVKIDYGQSYLN